jgi:hypothetical protein
MSDGNTHHFDLCPFFFFFFFFFFFSSFFFFSFSSFFSFSFSSSSYSTTALLVWPWLPL